MNARSQALVPLSTEQQAARQAVAETEKRRHQGNTLAEYPYAGAFFRCLNGSRRISLSDLRFFHAVPDRRRTAWQPFSVAVCRRCAD
ncbi:psiA family protein [Escherichia coli Envira 10/1]|nr:psiA family protein [Escherichia coli Envira 10/1]